jgi:hypothetical protein
MEVSLPTRKRLSSGVRPLKIVIMQLEDLFTDILENFPKQFAEDNITLSGSNLTLNETVYSSDKIVVTKGSHWYDVNRIDQIDVYTDYEHYRLLGLLVLATIFNHKLEDFRLTLSNSKSQVKEIRIRNGVADLTTPGLHLKPALFEYYPQRIDKHPFWCLSDIPRYDFPYLELNNEEEIIITEEDLKDRDILIIKGNYVGNAHLAEVLLDFSFHNQDIEEINLESDLGFGGVAPGSAELRLFSPKVSWFLNP